MADDDGMVELADEDELLAEFHKAGIFTDEERVQVERDRERAVAFQQWAGHALAQQRAMMANGFPGILQAEALRNQQTQQVGALSGLGSSLGGAFGALFGRWP
jgi:hypothetical protein